MKEINLLSYKKTYYFVVLLLLVKQYCDGLLLHQFNLPVLIFPSIDNTYWLFHLLQIPRLIAGSNFSLIFFDLLLLCLCISNLIWVNHVWNARLFFSIFFAYFICVNTFSGHHSHMLIGILLSNIVFCFRTATLQISSIRTLRYYLMFAMGSAALWKICRGNFLDPTHFSTIIFNQNIYELYYNKSAIHLSLVKLLVQNQGLSQVLYLAATIVELSFIIGFFTRKFDQILFALFILFFVLDYFIMNLNFIEFGILLLPLFRVRKN